MVHILGAGIAGLTLASALERRGKAWHIYEKAAAAGSEASGKNAGIVRTYEADPVMRHFAEASLAYYRRSEPSFSATGLILRPWDVDYAEKPAGEREFSHRRFSGLFLPQNGTLEPMLLLERLTAASFHHGAISYGFDARLRFEGKHILALEDQAANTQRLFSEEDILVCACGEGTVAVALELEAPLGLIAHRRTLYEFSNRTLISGPVEWDEESGVYFRHSADGGTITATAGEQVPASQGGGEIAGEDDKLLQVIAKEFPFLTRNNLTGQRTCKRLTPLDNRPCVGPDSVYSRLFWFTGLGGRGISTAPALAESLADMICGVAVQPLLRHFSPSRARVN